LHKKFLEEDITGIDIMPFAAHLTTINLALQKLEEPTNFVRIASMDSLELSAGAKTENFKKEGIILTSLTTIIQKTMDDVREKTIRTKGTISINGKGKVFSIKPVDLVIMNPPFSDRNKLPKEYLKKLSNESNIGKILGNICGHQINLWGYFLALAHLLLKGGGKIAAVIPINIARGKDTKKIRDFIIDNYYIKYIVKPVKDIAFSESASFRDILLIAEKRKPNNSDITKIIFLKKSIKEIKEEDIMHLKNLDEKYFETRDVSYEEILKNRENLMPFLTSESIEKIFTRLISSKKLTKFDSSWIDIGLPYRPKGVAEGIFITTPFDESRVKRAFSIVLDSNSEEITIGIKSISDKIIKFKLKREEVKPALRTITGINTIKIPKQKLDYILIKRNDLYIKNLRKFNPKIPKSFPWNKHLKSNIINDGTNLVLPDKINLLSPNTHLISVMSEVKLYSIGPMLWYFKNTIFSEDELKILNLYLNSVLNIIQILLYKSETLGQHFRLLKSDWNLFKIINVNELSNHEKDILIQLFNRLENVEFPSILEQLKTNFSARVELDKTIFKILDFSDKEIDDWLPKIYNAIIEELQNYEKL
jgi:hypothetical protein